MLPIDGGSGPGETFKNGLELNRNTNDVLQHWTSSSTRMFKLVRETQIQYNMVSHVSRHRHETHVESCALTHSLRFSLSLVFTQNK